MLPSLQVPEYPDNRGYRHSHTLVESPAFQSQPIGMGVTCMDDQNFSVHSICACMHACVLVCVRLCVRLCVRARMCECLLLSCALRCFSKEEPKGSDCMEQFVTMSSCTRRFPELFPEETEEERGEAQTTVEAQATVEVQETVEVQKTVEAQATVDAQAAVEAQAPAAKKE